MLRASARTPLEVFNGAGWHQQSCALLTQFTDAAASPRGPQLQITCTALFHACHFLEMKEEVTK